MARETGTQNQVIDLLMCDPESGSRMQLVKAVKTWGYAAGAVGGEKEAWQILARPEAPRLVVISWNTSEAKDLGLCRKLKHTPGFPFTYVIVLTGKNDPQLILHGLEAGADEVLARPVPAEELRRRLAVGRRIIQTLHGAHPESNLYIPSYELEETLGEGAMGVVYRAVQLATGQSVALKVIRNDKGHDRDFFRFAREIEITRRLKHPNIVQIFDAHTGIGVYYYAMELIEGPDLATYVKQNHVTRIKRLQIMAEVCHGLAHAHERGIIHRDLKFTNVLINRQDVPKLVDFGLSKSLLESESDLDLSREGLAVGTPVFMSPEQAAFHPEKVGPHSDVYALGVMLYQLLLHQHPHHVEAKARDMLKRIAQDEIRPPRSLAPRIHPGLEAILLKALARDPAKRYGHAGEMEKALRRLLTPASLEEQKNIL